MLDPHTASGINDTTRDTKQSSPWILREHLRETGGAIWSKWDNSSHRDMYQSINQCHLPPF